MKQAIQQAPGMKLLKTAGASLKLDKLVYYWIDTWSIDQEDTRDKEVQIPLIGKIYQKASLVLVTIQHHFTFNQKR
jgi:hypothetical protein